MLHEMRMRTIAPVFAGKHCTKDTATCLVIELLSFLVCHCAKLAGPPVCELVTVYPLRGLGQPFHKSADTCEARQWDPLYDGFWRQWIWSGCIRGPQPQHIRSPEVYTLPRHMIGLNR